MSYTYVNGIYEVTTDIHDGYKRFNSRNAQYRHVIDHDLMMEQWDFVSYATPIMSIDYVLDTDSWNVLIVRCALDWSRSTTRQIVDFLKWIGCPITISDIKFAISVDDDFTAAFECEVKDDCAVTLMDNVAYRFDIRF